MIARAHIARAHIVRGTPEYEIVRRIADNLRVIVPVMFSQVEQKSMCADYPIIADLMRGTVESLTTEESCMPAYVFHGQTPYAQSLMTTRASLSDDDPIAYMIDTATHQISSGSVDLWDAICTRLGFAG